MSLTSCIFWRQFKISSFLLRRSILLLCQKDLILQSAIIRQLEIIGEAAKRLSDKSRAQMKTVPWKDVAGMRDRLIHDYFQINIKRVWDTVKQDVPKLNREIKIFLQNRKKK